MIERRALAISALSIFGWFCALAQTNAQGSVERTQRQATYAQLSRQIFHRQDDPNSGRFLSTEKASDIQSRLHSLILAEISSVLAQPTPSDADVANAVSAVQGDPTDKPFAQFFQLNGMQSLAIGYVILQGGDAIPDTQNYLEFYDRAQGTWEMEADAPTRRDFRGCTFSVAKMQSGVPSESWFLAWGKTIGDTGSRLKIRLYAFDGTAVRTVWERNGLMYGQITVSNESINLAYDLEYKSSKPNNRAHEMFHIGPAGLSRSSANSYDSIKPNDK